MNKQQQALPATRYSATSRLLHWLSALVILWATISGFLSISPLLSESTKALIAGFNVSVTLVFIPFFIWRILHRVTNPPPAMPSLLNDKQRKAAKAAHIGLYSLVSVVLISGTLMMESSFSFFGLFDVPCLISHEPTNHCFAWIHSWSTRLLAVLILLHLFALIKHHKNGIKLLGRMM